MTIAGTPTEPPTLYVDERVLNLGGPAYRQFHAQVAKLVAQELAARR